MATEKPRFSITVDEELLKAIEDYRFGNRIAMRSEAIVQLIKKGLETLENENKKKLSFKCAILSIVN